MDNKVIAIVPGHTLLNQGAINYLGETEYVFNSRIAIKLQHKLWRERIHNLVIKRDEGNYRKNGHSYQDQIREVANDCKESCATYSLHLHFNSFAEKAYGCEILLPTDNDEELISLAESIADGISELNIKKRGKDGIKFLSEIDRGYPMLKAVCDVGTKALLIEPAFANFRHKESIAIFENEDRYVDILVECLVEAIKRGK